MSAATRITVSGAQSAQELRTWGGEARTTPEVEVRVTFDPGDGAAALGALERLLVLVRERVWDVEHQEPTEEDG